MQIHKLLVFMLLIAGFEHPSLAAVDNYYKIGVLALRGNEVAIQRWSATADYLSQQIPNANFAIIPITLDSVDEVAHKNLVDFFIVNPATYVSLEHKYGVTRALTLRKMRQEHALTQFAGVIFTRADNSTVHSLKDLKKQTLIAVHEHSFGGWWMAWKTMLDAGIDPMRDLTSLRFKGFPQDKVVYAVLAGEATVGTVRTGILESMALAGEIDLGDIRVINSHPITVNSPFYRSTDLYPEWPFAVSPKVEDRVTKKVIMALLELSRTSKPMLAANIAGWTVPLDYQMVHATMKQLKVGPYEIETKIHFTELVKANWILILCIALALITVLALVVSHLARLNYRIQLVNKKLKQQVIERLQAEKETKRLAAFPENNPSPIFEFDFVDNKLIYANKHAASLFHDLNLKGRSHVLLENLDDFFARAGKYDKDMSIRREINIDNIYYEQHIFYAKKTSTIKVYCWDVSYTREMNRQIIYQAKHDSLTGLINRTEFERVLKNLISSSANSNKKHALCYVDLDQFKIVNDTCGHQAGDKLLKELSLILKRNIRLKDYLARLGGDEFGILLEDCPMEKAREIANMIRQTINEFRFFWDAQIFQVGASIGVVPIDANSTNVADMLSTADTACYLSKDQGGNHIHIFSLDDVALEQRRTEMSWVQKIRQALEEDRFVLYHQSIKSLGVENSNEKYYEILLRMLDTSGAIITPGQFLPAAERFNLAVDLDKWVVRHVLQSQELYEETIANNIVRLAINISGQSIGSEEFLDFINDQFGQSLLSPEKICFEITETSAIANLSRAQIFISDLKKIGCRFSLDDFGSGLSSFAYLKSLEVDYLKIDGHFIKDITENPVNLAMVESINNVGHIMGLKTIAEFVETEDILNKVSSIGVDYGQGYAISKPEPFDFVANALKAKQA